VGCKVEVGDSRAVGERVSQVGAASVEGRGVVGTGGATAKAPRPRQ
jgi:hypothetical protein